jgi:hypothetical protein
VFWHVQRDAGSKDMSNVRLMLEGAGGKFSFFLPIFFVLCGQERVKGQSTGIDFLYLRTPPGV